jgi:hypothetical protein
MENLQLTRQDLISGKYVGYHKASAPLAAKTLIRCIGFDKRGKETNVVKDSDVIIPSGASIVRLDQEYIEKDRTGYRHEGSDPKYPHKHLFFYPSKYMDSDVMELPDHSKLLHQVEKCFWGYSNTPLNHVKPHRFEKELNTNYEYHGRTGTFHSVKESI